ncbi:von Willebrand factor A domain containing protein [Echinococcus multilocularis]|uniref:von Willebrand factor A domain containing protein n=1 Tax=Echinococcus multilocularis TaxID=6211 RepID=A0A068Y018_ECHMU|nr:von Willebrand factor A domain containing protein [Echinococcus multilocularis]
MHGLIVCNKWPQVPVPLEKFNVHSVIVNNNADVSCEFAYKNSTSEIIETEFAFPLESTAAVYYLEAIIGKKHLVAHCRERIEAEETYSEAVKSGHTAFMMQEDYRMGDTFRMKLGNIPAGETIKLTFRYVVPLYVREVDKTIERFSGLQAPYVLIFSMPLLIGERYDPNPGAHGCTAAPHLSAKMSFVADICATGGVLSVTSAHQKFQVSFVDEAKEHAKITVPGNLDLSHDFELELALQNPHALCAPCELGCASKGGFLGMHCITAAFLPNISQSPASDGGKREIIFVIDRSGSMSGSKIQNTKESLLLFLKSLPKKCRFQIVGFGSSFHPLFPQPVDYNKENVERALEYQKTLSANMGGTEVLSVLKFVYDTPVTGVGWYRCIIFLTDGEISNQDEVIGLVTRNQQSARLFAIGLGDEVSTSLIWGVARAGRGTAVFIRSGDNLRAVTMSVLGSALQPMLTDVELKWDVKVDGKAPEILTVPSQLPPLFSGVFMTAFGLFQADDSKSPRIEGTLKLSYKLNDTVHSQETAVQILPVEQENLGLHRLAAKAQLLELVDKHSALHANDGDKVDDSAKSEIRQQIVDISTNTNVISPFTSFVGVDPDKIENFVKAPPRPPIAVAHAMHSANLCFSRVAAPCANSLPVGAPTGHCFGAAAVTCEFESCVDGAKVAHFRAGGPPGSPPSFLKNVRKIKSKATGSEPTPSAPTDAVVFAVELQDFDGFWLLNEDLAKLFRSTLSQLTSSKPSDVENTKIWATALVVAYLRTHMDSRHEEWEMVVQKAMDWLKENCPNPQSLVEKAKTALAQLLPKA